MLRQLVLYVSLSGWSPGCRKSCTCLGKLEGGSGSGSNIPLLSGLTDSTTAGGDGDVNDNNKAEQELPSYYMTTCSERAYSRGSSQKVVKRQCPREEFYV